MADKNVEYVAKLSPMQQGILFHTLYAPESGVYVIQVTSQLEGRLDRRAFELAWRRIVERHTVLRTGFFWEELDKPLQVVQRQVTLPWTSHDWRSLSADEQADEQAALLQADRRQGFDISAAPLMRITLLQLADERHTCIWSFHHLILDGWSLPLILREVFTLYSGLTQGRELQLPRAQPYHSYIGWLRRQNHEEAEQFWRRTLAGFTAATALGGEQIAAQHTDAATYAEQRLQLSETTTTALQTLARSHGLTVNTLLQGAWAMLLHRYSQEHDIVFGVTVSGRPANLPGSESMVGIFINTLPRRVRILPHAPLLAWLKTLQDQQAELQQYEYSALVEIQHWSDIAPGRPLFESILIFENYPVNDSVRDLSLDLRIRDIQASEQTNYPVTLFAALGQTLALQLSYDSQRFSAATIETMLGHLEVLLQAIVASPHQPLANVSLLRAAERERLLVEWNDTAMELPPQRVDQLFAIQARQTPDAVAVRLSDQQLSYGELNTRADQLAARLTALGVGPETMVGICVERSLEMIVGLLGILKAGGAYVPLDPTYPQERLQFMISDSGLQLLVTQQPLLSALEGLIQHPTTQVRHVVSLDSAETYAVEPHASAPEIALTNIAYVIYTSGSTGRPKGVQIPHIALTNFLLAMQRQLRLTPADRLLSVTTLSFDIAALELFLPLTVGAELLLVDRALAADGSRLSETLASSGTTIMQATPATWQMLLQAGWPGDADLTVLCGGEALPDALAEQLIARCGRLWNMYGPTETTIWSTMGQIETTPVTIGRPIANTDIYVLDAQLQPVPIGAAGELYIGGSGLARGYLNRPTLTAERFIPNPFGTICGARLYNTGDLARYSADGRLEHLGRGDDQVKLRGYRIELGEIATALDRHAGVRQSVVLAREDVPGEKRLVAYIIPAQPQPPTLGELRSFLQESLPSYMLPTAVVVLEAFPMTPNGKIDRRALPQPEHNRPTQSHVFIAPRTKVEQQIAEIWADVLKLEQVGIHDNFFDLGGHSITALQVISRLHEAFRLALPLRSLLEAATIAQLARAVEVGRELGLQAALDTLAPVDLHAEVRLDPLIDPTGLPQAMSAEPRAILLTGATGFVGAFLLAELLRETQAAIYCLVRAADAEQGRAKLSAAFASFGLYEPAFETRVMALPGDLARPRLGLSEQQFDTLAQTIDAIYHNGALVNFAYPYSALRAANVLGTVEVLRLAAQSVVKPVHFISTTGIFYSQAYSGVQTVREDDALGDCDSLNGGYPQSKWVAEQILTIARSRGIPVAVYRPGRVIWNTQTGVWNPNDVVYQLLAGCLEIGSAPLLDFEVELTPIDTVSRAIVHLSRQADSLGHAFHLVNPQTVHWNDLVGWCVAAGQPLLHLSLPEWLAAVNAAAQTDTASALQSLVTMATEQLESQLAGGHTAALRFDIQNTLAGLAGSAIQFPQAEPTLIQPFVSHLLRDTAAAALPPVSGSLS